jgi:flagellar transcriptional activator FlhC
MTALIKAYRLYTEQMLLDEIEPLLSLTRAWTRVRFF